MIIPAAAKVMLARNLQSATSAAERSEAVRAYAQEWGVSEATARRHAGIRVRARSARRRGYPVSTEVLDQVVALWLDTGTEKYETATMPLADLIDMCETAGILPKGVLSVGQLRRYIREQAITLEDQRRPGPHIHLASRHPNHAHLFDVTRCRQWYLRPDGRFDVQSFAAGTAEYRNKDLRGAPLYRYVLTDHASGNVYVQYCTDETVPTLLTFLYGAWAAKRQRHQVGPTGTERWWPAPFDPERYDEWSRLPDLRGYHFRGAPEVLIVDRASANQSEFTRELCSRLRVQHVLAQEARAKGQVESMMWTWERKFEARLAVQPAPDLETLNVWALDFAAHWCLQAVHSRHGMTRSQAWAMITPEQLRELPEWPVFRELARRAPEPRTVKSGPKAGTGLVYHEGQAWLVPDGANLIGQTVQVSYSVFATAPDAHGARRPLTLEARTEDGRALVLEPLARDRFGFFTAAAVIGEKHARHPDTPTQKAEKRLEAVRAALPPLQVFGREGEKRDVPALLPPRQGVEIPIQAVGVREISETQFTRRVRAALGGRALTEEEGAERDRRLAGRSTVAESDVDEFVAWCLERERTEAAQHPKVVNLFR